MASSPGSSTSSSPCHLSTLIRQRFTNDEYPYAIVAASDGQYLIRWAGDDTGSENSWEPHEHLHAELIDRFEEEAARKKARIEMPVAETPATEGKAKAVALPAVSPVPPPMPVLPDDYDPKEDLAELEDSIRELLRTPVSFCASGRMSAVPQIVIRDPTADTPMEMSVICPPSAAPGSQLCVRAANGQSYEVTVPLGSLPGHRFEFSIPLGNGVAVLGCETSCKYPLKLDAVAKLLAVGEQVPSGRGTETVVDESVRKARQLSVYNFHVEGGENWDSAFEAAFAQAASELSPGDASVCVVLRKLLVYSKGDFVAAHRDAPRDGVFATLAITLPSKHSGGDLIVRHAGAAKTISSAPATAAKTCQWAAWYAGVEHEISPVLHGNKVVLLYDLHRSSAPSIPAAFASSPSPPAVATLLRLQAAADDGLLEGVLPSGESVGRVGYLLEHKYPASAVKPKSLKGRDALLYKILSAAGLETAVAPVEVRFNKFGYFFDEEKHGLFGAGSECELEVSEFDPLQKLDKSESRISRFVSRPLSDVFWLHDLEQSVGKASRTDRNVVKGSGDLHEAYVYSALLVHLDGGGGLEDFSSEHSRRLYPDYPDCGLLAQLF